MGRKYFKGGEIANWCRMSIWLFRRANCPQIFNHLNLGWLNIYVLPMSFKSLVRPDKIQLSSWPPNRLSPPWNGKARLFPYMGRSILFASLLTCISLVKTTYVLWMLRENLSVSTSYTQVVWSSYKKPLQCMQLITVHFVQKLQQLYYEILVIVTTIER